MGERKPARDWYDIAVDIGATEGPSGSYAGAIIKYAYRIPRGPGPCVRAPAVALENDLRDEELDPRVPAHSDFWPRKRYVDVGVIGNAYAPGGRPVQQMSAAISIGSWRKQVDVLGDRAVEWTAAGRPRIGQAEPFVEMPLSHRNAYGGCDFRAPFDDDDPQAPAVALQADHPGLYPRNPWGMGYIAVGDPLDGFRLPNLEDPADRLTDARLIADPREWYVQPLPWYLDWMPVNCFPRNLFITIDCEPWYPPPDDGRLKETHYGLLPIGYRGVLHDQKLGAAPSWQFQQEASHGLVLPAAPYSTRLKLEGMHPELPVLDCMLPDRPPTVDIMIENEAERVVPELTTIAIYPDLELLTMVYTARKHMPRPFIPGIHKHIPIAVSVDGDLPFEYVPPPTLKDQLRAQEGVAE